MRYFIFALAAVLILSSGASAQENPEFARLLETSYFTLAPVSGSAAPALTTPLGLAPVTSAPAPFASAANAFPTSAAAQPPQMVQGVFVNYNWQAYFGYTFVRFNEASGAQRDTNGFNYSMQYYFTDWFALDCEFAATHTSLNAWDGWFLFGGGGPRFRWSGPRGLEIWGHALVGYSHFTPQTSLGSQDAFAYEVGGGVDFNLRHSRWALRLGADMLGSRYFNDDQYNPKAFAGVVYKF